MARYSAGRYVDGESSRLSLPQRFFEYLGGVTLARQSINSLQPRAAALVEGDVVEIGGFNNYFKERYTRGRWLNLDRLPAEGIVDIVGDAEQLGALIPAGTLGGVFCVSVIEHTRDLAKLIDEIHRALRPGGIAFISSPWLFESHMEPQDYLRFSKHQLEVFSIASKWSPLTIPTATSGLSLTPCSTQSLCAIFWAGYSFCWIDVCRTIRAGQRKSPALSGRREVQSKLRRHLWRHRCRRTAVAT